MLRQPNNKDIEMLKIVTVLLAATVIATPVHAASPKDTAIMIYLASEKCGLQVSDDELGTYVIRSAVASGISGRENVLEHARSLGLEAELLWGGLTTTQQADICAAVHE